MRVMLNDVALIGPFSGRTVEAWTDYNRVMAAALPGDCPFCEPDPAYLVSSTEHAHLLVNRFPYVVWDGSVVMDHLMVVPKTHRSSMGEMSDEEHRDLRDLIREYEPAGYSVYTRSPGNIGRTQPHVHTHLIKTAQNVSPVPMPALIVVPDHQPDHLSEPPHTLTA